MVIEIIIMVFLTFQSMEIHETIAECMIFANHWVAKKICETFPTQSLVSTDTTVSAIEE